MIGRILKFLLWTIPKKIVWWIFIRPIVLIILLGLFIIYSITKFIMTRLLRIWYPNQEFV